MIKAMFSCFPSLRNKKRSTPGTAPGESAQELAYDLSVLERRERIILIETCTKCNQRAEGQLYGFQYGRHGKEHLYVMGCASAFICDKCVRNEYKIGNMRMGIASLLLNIIWIPLLIFLIGLNSEPTRLTGFYYTGVVVLPATNKDYVTCAIPLLIIMIIVSFVWFLDCLLKSIRYQKYQISMMKGVGEQLAINSSKKSITCDTSEMEFSDSDSGSLGFDVIRAIFGEKLAVSRKSATISGGHHGNSQRAMEFWDSDSFEQQKKYYHDRIIYK